MQDEIGNAEIHQGKRDGAAGAAGADLHHGRVLGAGAADAFSEAVAPSRAIEVVAGGAAIGREHDGVDRADLGGARVHGIEQRNDLLLERKGDVGADEARGLDRLKKLRQPRRQAIGVQQMIIAVDPGRRESIGEQSRRHRSLDVRAKEPDQHPAFGHRPHPPPSSFFTIALALEKSICPANRSLSAVMVRPMSLSVAASSSLISEEIAEAASMSDMCLGR